MLLGNSRVITVAAKQKQDNINHMNEGTSPYLATPLSLSNHGGEIGMSSDRIILGHGLDLTFHAIWPGLALGTFPSPFLFYSISLFVSISFSTTSLPSISFPFPCIYFLQQRKNMIGSIPLCFHVLCNFLLFLSISLLLFPFISIPFHSFPLLSTPFHSFPFPFILS